MGLSLGGIGEDDAAIQLVVNGTTYGSYRHEGIVSLLIEFDILQNPKYLYNKMPVDKFGRMNEYYSIDDNSVLLSYVNRNGIF